MENKEVEYLIECLLPKDKTSINYGHIEGIIRNIIVNFEQLEKENAELKKYRGTDDTADAMIYASMVSQKQEITELRNQLQAKDKALDKAIKKITLDNDEGTQFLDSQYEYWKEWCENE
ncbi:hypothetical protein ACWG0P_07180 [Amedibacillus sp. YH-ame6]